MSEKLFLLGGSQVECKGDFRLLYAVLAFFPNNEIGFVVEYK